MNHTYAVFLTAAAALITLYCLYRFLKWLFAAKPKQRRGDYTSADGTHWDFDPPLGKSNRDYVTIGEDGMGHWDFPDDDQGFDFGGGESGGGGADGSWGDDD